MTESSTRSASIEELRAEVLAPISPKLASVAPSIGDLATSFAYGQVWSREGLSKRDRSIATIAALAAVNCPSELKLHALRGLANGLTKEEVGEIITHLTPYLGFPLCVTAAAALGEVIPRAKAGDTTHPEGP
jgi:4-carboxymuconolactone decarboxylase